MRAIHCVSYGEPKDLTLVELAEPVPGAGEVVVAVEAAGLGFVDGLHVRGGYQVKKPLPFIPGGEIAGTVIALGIGAPSTLLGHRVVAFSAGGGLAERVVLPAAACVALPDGFSSRAAAASLVNYCTGLFGFVECGALQPGETVLILGAGGGVGMAAIDIAKSLGATVVAAASSESKLAACRACGADLTVDYSQPDWRKTLERQLGDRRPTVIYDPVGGAWSETAFRCLAPGGRHLVVGFASGEIPRIPLNLPLLKRSSIVGVDWGGHIRANPQANGPIVERLVALVQAGKLHPEPTTTYPLAESPGVLQRLLERQSVGKPVIIPNA